MRFNVARINSEQEIRFDAMARESDMASRFNMSSATFVPPDDDGHAKQHPSRMVRAAMSSRTRSHAKNVSRENDDRGIDRLTDDDRYPNRAQSYWVTDSQNSSKF